MTITLQDVAIILRLRIHGLPITRTYDIDWSLLCYELVSVTPPTSEIKGSTIPTRWLCHQFSHPPIDSNDATLEWYAQAFILALLVKGPIGVHHGLLDEDQGLQDKALLDAGLPTDPLGCFMEALRGRLSYPSLANQEIWRTMSPLICFDIVE
ncbi:Serine/threonine-protein phosphatase 7 long form-like [Vitis vinifera]|uniref:Serine/threonine-protein phosphatase 7 long form-like n=1 Tax=Vitis vinifera TaxID=29760 RepID=A0A438KAW3_VITVI|nr:Serine/threonine-protein phosphatase 7 long form-like [Vitis vinifera]